MCPHRLRAPVPGACPPPPFRAAPRERCSLGARPTAPRRGRPLRDLCAAPPARCARRLRPRACAPPRKPLRGLRGDPLAHRHAAPAQPATPTGVAAPAEHNPLARLADCVQPSGLKQPSPPRRSRACAIATALTAGSSLPRVPLRGTGAPRPPRGPRRRPRGR